MSYFRGDHRFLQASNVELVSREKKKLMMIVMINIMLKNKRYMYILLSVG